ncbi:DSCAML1 [Mytilus edulis]|uniref:DSCAML1 n=1 Tax=Mytilus edulis TaxID=6550 RepID=A0A8S3RWL8_MYTED|nr:DSCAML1 [Mytilus edulis]
MNNSEKAADYNALKKVANQKIRITILRIYEASAISILHLYCQLQVWNLESVMYYIVAVFVYLGLVSGQKTLGQVEWNVTHKVSSFGQNLTLFCAVDDCCATFPGWVLWNYDGRDYETLVIDLRGFNSPKYAGNLRKNGFTLVLKNLTESDMNRNYSCTYGSIVGEKKLLVTEESFHTTPMVTVKNHPTFTESTNLTVTESTNLTIGFVIGLNNVHNAWLQYWFSRMLADTIDCWAPFLKRRYNGYRPTSSTETHDNILSLVVEPGNANVILGNNQIISCTLSGQPSAQDITWYFTPTNESKNEICPRNNAAKYSGGTISDPSLTILNFQTSDSGAYECSATNAAGTGNSNSSVLTCISILSLVVEPDNANVILGNNQIISCTLSGQPSAQDIIWYFTPTNESKNEICPRNNAAKYSGGTISDPSLTILNFQTSDSGAYECSATNAAGTGNSNSSVLTCISNCQKLKDSFLSEIATRLGHDWRQVQIHLEITTTELEQIERKYINEPITQTTEALIMWRNRKSSSPEEDNINDLINALEFVQRNDIIDDLKLRVMLAN